MFGVFKPVIGLSQATAVVVTEWPDAAAADAGGHTVLAGLEGAETVDRDIWTPTLRPAPGERPTEAKGFYSHRAFDIAAADWERFRDLSGEAWGNWEATHAAKTVGFWLCRMPPGPGLVRVRLMAWYESLDAWERSRWWNAGAKTGSEAAFDRFKERAALMVDTRVSILQLVNG
ncbi:MAG: hypothetical protein R3D67_02515 [Hyphomicrobiaceae bacterium]